MSMKLSKQIWNFGLIGGLCFIIDFSIYTLLTYNNFNYLWAGFWGFFVSIIINYLLNMKYVFERNGNISKTYEFIIYIVLSLVGLLLNEFILYAVVKVFSFCIIHLEFTLNCVSIKILAKIVATLFVSLFNFVSRKLVFEKRWIV